MNRKILRGALLLLLASVCLWPAAVTAQQPAAGRARRGGLDNLSLPSTTARVATASNAATVWQTFAPEGAGFSVSLPGLPEETTRAKRESAQAGAQGRSYRLVSGGLKYEIGRTGQLPEQFMSRPDYVEKFFVGAARGINAALAQEHGQIKFKLVSEQVISLEGYEGREYEFDAEGHRAVARLILMESSIFGLSVTGAKSEMTDENVNRFFNSFALAQ